MQELAERVLREAVFQPCRVLKSYGGYDEKDSPAIEAARKGAQEAAFRIAAEVTSKLMDDSDFRKTVTDHLVAALPLVLKGWWNDALENNAMETAEKLRLKMQEGI